MNIGLSLISTNVGMSVENMVLLIITFGGLIFFAKDFKVGLIVNLMMNAGAFIFFYQYSMNYAPFLIIFFMYLIILSLTLYSVNKSVQTGGII